MKLSRQIALYVGTIVLIICLGLGFTSYKLSSDTLIEEAEKNLVLLAKAGIGNVESVIQGNIGVLEGVANRNLVRTMNWEEQLPSLQQEFVRLEQDGYLGLGVVFPDGTTKYVDGSEANLGDRDYVIKAFQGQSNVSDVLISRVTNSAVLMYAVPIYDLEGNIGGVLVARRPGDALNDITDEMRLGENGYSYIIGSDGTIYSHPNRDYIMDQRNAFVEIETNGELKNWGLALQEIGIGNPGSAYYELNGRSIYMGIEPMASTGWSFGVVALEDELLEGLVSMRNAVIIGSLVFILLGIGAAIYFGRRIAKPMVYGSQFALNMAAGDFTQEMPKEYLERKDEIGGLAQAFETLSQNFRKTIGGIQASAQELAAASEEMTAIAENSSANMQEVSASTEEISASLEEVSAASEEISASSQEMHASTAQLLNDMKEGNKVAQEIEEKAVKIQGEVVDSQQKALAISNELGQRLKEGIEKAKIVNEISNMANQIAGIADQTNLLALNAAIEAARAGEQGRGFAVVADEVRKLASDSTETVSNIQKLTVQVQENIQALIADTNELLKFMSTEVEEDYQKFLETAEDYKNDAQTFFNLTEQSAQMGEEVLNAVDEVTRSITEVTQTIGESAEGASQIAKGTDETSKSMVEISEAAMKLSKMSEELTLLTNQFKVS